MINNIEVTTAKIYCHLNTVYIYIYQSIRARVADTMKIRKLAVSRVRAAPWRGYPAGSTF